MPRLSALLWTFFFVRVVNRMCLFVFFRHQVAVGEGSWGRDQHCPDVGERKSRDMTGFDSPLGRQPTFPLRAVSLREGGGEGGGWGRVGWEYSHTSQIKHLIKKWLSPTAKKVFWSRQRQNVDLFSISFPVFWLFCEVLTGRGRGAVGTLKKKKE